MRVVCFSDAWVTAWIRRRTAHWQGLVANVSEESLENYTDRVYLSSGLKNPGPRDDPGLAERAEYYIRRGLKLLDVIPRDHPFWDKTNNKATEYKASLWFRQVLEANPDDAETRWIVAALKLKRCGTQLEALLAPLVPDDPSNLRWLVGATVWVWYSSGADYTAALRHELTMLNNDPAVRSLMQAPRWKRRARPGGTNHPQCSGGELHLRGRRGSDRPIAPACCQRGTAAEPCRLFEPGKRSLSRTRNARPRQNSLFCALDCREPRYRPEAQNRQRRGITSWLACRPVALGYLESDHSTQRLEYLGAPCRLARQVKELWRAPQNPLVRDTAADPHRNPADETANSGTLVMRVKGTEKSRQQRRCV